MWRTAVIASTVALLAPATAESQVFRVGGRGEPAFWISGSAGYLSHGRVHDGETQTRWDFAGSLQWRASIERAIQRESSIGVTATWSNMSLRYHSLDGSFLSRNAHADVWQLLASFHAGGGSGFHQVLQVNAGVAGFTGFTADDTGEALPHSDHNLALGIGYGFGYTLGARSHINLVQDFGYVFRSRRGLPGDVGGSAQTSTLRVSLRHGFGRRGL